MANLLLIIFVIVSILISVVWGLLRGLSKARIRGISVIACAIAAVVLAVVSRQWIVTDWFIEESVIPLLQEMNNTEIVIEALGMSQTLNGVLLNCITSLITPILCLVYFLLLSFLSWFVFLIVSLACGGAMRRHNARCCFSRVRASVWGLIQGLVIVTILLVPVAAEMEITPEQARCHPKKNLITRSVGVDEVVMSDIFERPNLGGYLLLCSDGLSNVLTDEQLRAEVLAGGNENCCHRLLSAALEAGATDNVTVILAQL